MNQDTTITTPHSNKGIYAGLAGSLLFLFVAFFLPLKNDPPMKTGTLKPEIMTIETVQELKEYYKSINYTLDNLQKGKTSVPRIYLDRIINNWAENETVTAKKSLFYRTMLPLVLRVNELILEKRKKLYEIAENYSQTGQLSHENRSWLKKIAIRYRIIRNKQKLIPSASFFDELFLRVDTIPVSLALGQMAYESAYATSRFAGEGNALFGQWHWGKGMLPRKKRNNMGDYRVANFTYPIDSMKAYALNINTNEAYQEFREERAVQRSEGKKFLDGYKLAKTLERYSERREKYVKTLQGIIKKNGLDKLEKVQLKQETPVILVPQLETS